MPDADDITDAIAEAATTPKSATVDGNSVQARDIREMREARDDQQAQQAATRPGFGLRFQQIAPTYR